MKPAVNIGKSSLTPKVVESVDESLTANELVKVSVLKNCDATVSQLAITLSERIGLSTLSISSANTTLFS